MADTIKFTGTRAVCVWLADAIKQRNGERDIPISAVGFESGTAHFTADNKPAQMIYDVWLSQNDSRYFTLGVHWRCMPDGTNERRVWINKGAEGIVIDRTRMELLADEITGVIWGAL